jgi:hypothetical protein
VFQRADAVGFSITSENEYKRPEKWKQSLEKPGE